MLLFKNKDSGNYFGVHNQLGRVEFLGTAVVKAFEKHSHYFDGIDYLELPDMATVKQFRKVISKGILKDIPLSETKSFLIANYPEFFI